MLEAQIDRREVKELRGRIDEHRHNWFRHAATKSIYNSVLDRLIDEGGTDHTINRSTNRMHRVYRTREVYITEVIGFNRSEMVNETRGTSNVLEHSITLLRRTTGQFLVGISSNYWILLLTITPKPPSQLRYLLFMVSCELHTTITRYEIIEVIRDNKQCAINKTQLAIAKRDTCQNAILSKHFCCC